MKIIKTVFLVFFVTLVAMLNIKAGPNPPKPTMNSANSVNGTGDDDTPPPPDGDLLPIDSHIVFLLGAGVFLGIAIVYKNKIKKASM